MKRQIKTNSAVIGAQKSSYKYIDQNLHKLESSERFGFNQAIFSENKIVHRSKINLFYIVNAPIKPDCHASMFAKRRRFIFKCEEIIN